MIFYKMLLTLLVGVQANFRHKMFLKHHGKQPIKVDFHRSMFMKHHDQARPSNGKRSTAKTDAKFDVLTWKVKKVIQLNKRAEALGLEAFHTNLVAKYYRNF